MSRTPLSLAMKSHLMRHVCQRPLPKYLLLRSRLIHTQSKPRIVPRHLQNGIGRPPRRTFYTGGDQDQAIMRDTVVPGLPEMMELNRRILLVVRHNPAEKLVKAFNDFIRNRQQTGLPIEDLHAFHLYQTVQDLEARQSENRAGSPWLTQENLRAALEQLSCQRGEFVQIHNALARSIYDLLQERRRGDSVTVSSRETLPAQREVDYLVAVLCRTGDSFEARALLDQYQKDTSQPLHRAWPRVLAGFVRENSEGEILRTVEMMHEQSIPLTATMRQLLTCYYASKDNVAKTKDWFDQSILEAASEQAAERGGSGIIYAAMYRALPRDEVFKRLLEFCVRNNELGWGQSVMIQADQHENPQKATWDAIVLTAAATGRGADEIEKMFRVMTSKGQRPDIDTINGLIEFAISRKDAYMAERYLALGKKWKAKPNAKHFILQVTYRLDVGDLDGALASYATLRKMEPEKSVDDFAMTSKLLEALCARPSTDLSTVNNFFEEIQEFGAPLYHSTVLALTLFYLRHENYAQVSDILQTYAYMFGTIQRTELRDRMAELALDASSTPKRAWDIYILLINFFQPETQRQLRNTFMSYFFTHGQSDHGRQIFESMATDASPDAQPDLSTYVSAFESIASVGDTDALETIHNRLKLDTNVDPCTELYTALMLAYTGCQRPRRALEFWYDISTSVEGPSYATLHALFRACEASGDYVDHAEQVWTRLRSLDIAVAPDLAASYIGSLGGTAQLDAAKRLLLDMPAELGFPPDELIIASLFNSLRGTVVQRQVEQWLKQHFGPVWYSLEAKGLEELETGMRCFTGVDRTVKAASVPDSGI